MAKRKKEVYVSERSRKDRSNMKSNVTMENERFMKRFCVKAENQQEAYYILTPHMMEYIIKMADKSDGTVYRNRHSSAGNRNHWYCADLQMPA